MTDLISKKFDKHQRLLHPKDFQKVFNDGHFRIHQESFMWFVRVQDAVTGEGGKLESRLGLAITKKKVKRAHERNRIKRLTKEYFRHAHHELLMPVDLVLTIKQSPEHLCNADFVAQLRQSFVLLNRKLKQHQIKQVDIFDNILQPL